MIDKDSLWRGYLSCFNFLKHPFKGDVEGSQGGDASGLGTEVRGAGAAETRSARPVEARSVRSAESRSVRSAEAQAVRPSVLALGTVVSGTIHSETGLVVFGQVNGDIFSQGDIEVRGEVTGNLSGANIRILEGRVQGNIRAEAYCQVLQGVLEGDISAAECEIDGTVQGNIASRDSLNVHRSSVIRGDIATRILQIEGEAQLSGMVQMETTAS